MTENGARPVALTVSGMARRVSAGALWRAERAWYLVGAVGAGRADPQGDTHMELRRIAGALAAAGTLACEGESVGTADGGGDVAADVAPADGGDRWACLGRVAPVTPGGAMVTITLNAVGFSTGMPVPGLTVKACARADLRCAAPLSTGSTGATGSATLAGPVGPQGFDGYLEITGGTGANEVVPTRMFPNPPLAAGARSVTSRLIEREAFTLLGSVLMARLDEGTGMITAAASDCDRGPAEGATITASPAPVGARQFYTGNNGLPNLAGTQTGMAGSGGMVNVPPGEYTLTAARVSPAARIGSAAVSVRGGFVTAINVGPSP